MTKQEIKDNAPCGATHYTVIIFMGVTYIRYIKDFPYYWDNNGWQKCNSYFEAKPL